MKKRTKKTRPYRRLKERLKLIREIDRAMLFGVSQRKIMRTIGITSPSTLSNWRRERRESRTR